MSAEVLKNIMINKINSVSKPMDDSVPELVQLAISESITEYINSNVKLIGSYSGVTPLGTPESVPLDSWNVVGSITYIGIPDGLDSWMKDISSKIQVSFYTGSGVSHPIAPVLSFPLMNINSDIEELGKIHKDNYEDPQNPVILRICEWIVEGLSTGYVTEVPAGLSGTGVFTVSKVEV